MKNLKKLCEYFAVAFPIVLVCGFIWMACYDERYHRL